MRTTALSILLSLAFTASALAQVQRPLPVIERLEPTSGPPGSTVIVVGRHFDDAQTLWLGETQLEVIDRHPNRWTVRIPEGGAQSGTVDVRVARGTVNGPRFRVAQAAPPPVIASLTPTNGAPGTEVVLRGQNFSARATENQVHLGELPVVVQHASPTELTVLVPNGAVSAPFRVRVAGAGEATSTASFTIAAATTIASFEPAIAAPGARVTIRGTGFSRNRGHVRVTLGEARTRVISASETELVVEIPRRNAASGRFTVEIRGGGTAHGTAELRVRVPPVVRSFEPAAVPPGTRVTVHGEHFGTDVREISARIGETALTVRDLADDRVVVEIPAGTPSGPIEITAVGAAPVRSRASLTVLEPPSIASLAPESGPAGTIVTITGRGFSARAAENTVTMSGQPVAVERASATELRVRVSEAPSGPFVVTVARAGEARSQRPFVVTHPPTVEGFSPPSGGPGVVVRIRGTRFGTRPNLVEVRLGETPAQVRSVTDTEIEVIVPERARSAPFRVTVRLEGSATSRESFTVSTPPAP
jgi:hypothetical protein